MFAVTCNYRTVASVTIRTNEVEDLARSRKLAVTRCLRKFNFPQRRFKCPATCFKFPAAKRSCARTVQSNMASVAGIPCGQQ